MSAGGLTTSRGRRLCLESTYAARELGCQHRAAQVEHRTAAEPEEQSMQEGDVESKVGVRWSSRTSVGRAADSFLSCPPGAAACVSARPSPPTAVHVVLAAGGFSQDARLSLA